MHDRVVSREYFVYVIKRYVLRQSGCSAGAHADHFVVDVVREVLCRSFFAVVFDIVPIVDMTKRQTA